VGRTKNHKFISRRLQVIVDAHPKNSLVSSCCFSNRIRQIYRYSLHCTNKVLDKGLAPSNTHICSSINRTYYTEKGLSVQSDLDAFNALYIQYWPTVFCDSYFYTTNINIWQLYFRLVYVSDLHLNEQSKLSFYKLIC